MPLLDVPTGTAAHMLRVRVLRALEDAGMLEFIESTRGPHPTYTIMHGTTRRVLDAVEVIAYAVAVADTHRVTTGKAVDLEDVRPFVVSQ